MAVVYFFSKKTPALFSDKERVKAFRELSDEIIKITKGIVH